VVGSRPAIAAKSGSGITMGAFLSHLRPTTRALSRIQFLVATTTIVAALAFWTSTDFAEVEKAAEAKVSDASLAVSELADRSLLAIDVVLESAAARLSERGLDNLGSDSDRNYLTQLARRLPETGVLFVVDKAGNTVAGTAFYPPQINLSDREWFRVLQDGKAELFVGHALKGRGVHNLFFPVARSIRGADGTFIGAVQVGVEVTYIASLFRNLSFGHGAHLGLYGTHDGEVVARYPMSEALLGETVARAPYTLAFAQSQAQSWIGWIDSGQDELVSARRLNGWPLIASAGLSKGEVYSNAWTRLLWRSVIASLILGAFLTLNVLILRQSRREAVLIGELEHRGRNMLNVVVALIDRARESTKSSDEFASSVRGRIRSMASAQALLSKTRWRGVNLADLIRTELEPYETTANATLDGPQVLLTPRATHGVAMVVHELTTNAAKYGALSQQGGQVSVRWMVMDRHSAVAMLWIQWKETGGPKVAPPARQGHGSGLIRDLLNYELDGSVDLVFAPDGVSCTITLPAQSSIDTTG
jgi:two-component sensor histidine kinase